MSQGAASGEVITATQNNLYPFTTKWGNTLRDGASAYLVSVTHSPRV